MRLVLLRIVAILSALSWFVFPGFGLVDLLVSWDEDWPVALEAGWGLFATVLVGAAFVAVAVRPRRCAPALVQLSVATLSLAVSALATAEAPALPLVAFIAVETAAVAALARWVPGAEPIRPVTTAPSLPLVALGVAAAGPWTGYALTMYRANRLDAPVDVSVGVDHFAVQGALAIGLVVLALLGAVWPRGRRLLGVNAGLAGAYLGLVSLAWPVTPGGLGRVWSVLALAWGVCVAGLATFGSLRRSSGGRAAHGPILETDTT